MAPEVLSPGVTYNTSADWWSLGCLIYHMLVGFVSVAACCAAFVVLHSPLALQLQSFPRTCEEDIER